MEPVLTDNLLNQRSDCIFPRYIKKLFSLAESPTYIVSEFNKMFLNLLKGTKWMIGSLPAKCYQILIFKVWRVLFQCGFPVYLLSVYPWAIYAIHSQENIDSTCVWIGFTHMHVHTHAHTHTHQTPRTHSHTHWALSDLPRGPVNS